MRYLYNDETRVLKPVKYVKKDGRTVSNPSDELVDELGAGYPLIESEKPEYDPEKQVITPEYSFDGAVITQIWKVTDIPEPAPDPTEAFEQRITALEEENAALREAIKAGVNM